MTRLEELAKAKEIEVYFHPVVVWTCDIKTGFLTTHIQAETKAKCEERVLEILEAL